eukprot:4093375-Pleurochrysis_carterae.AAC.1
MKKSLCQRATFYAHNARCPTAGKQGVGEGVGREPCESDDKAGGDGGDGGDGGGYKVSAEKRDTPRAPSFSLSSSP